MGYSNALDIAAIGGRTALHWHLTSNHFPPLPARLVATAEKAIKHLSDNCQIYFEGDGYSEFNDGTWEHEIELPEGLSCNGKTTQTVSEIVEALHLDAFITVELSKRFADEHDPSWREITADPSLHEGD